MGTYKGQYSVPHLQFKIANSPGSRPLAAHCSHDLERYFRTYAHKNFAASSSHGTLQDFVQSPRNIPSMVKRQVAHTGSPRRKLFTRARKTILRAKRWSHKGWSAGQPDTYRGRLVVTDVIRIWHAEIEKTAV